MSEAGKERRQPRVLIVDDDPPLCDLLQIGLSMEGFTATTRTSAEAALSALASHDYDCLVTDLNLPNMGGLELCKRVASEWPHLAVVVITAFGSLDSAVAAIRAGAQDFIAKPVQIEDVRLALERATVHLTVQHDSRIGAHDCDAAASAPQLLGDSPAMRELMTLLARVAASDASVLITGESGTGKELVARALHHGGARSAGPFVALNCSAIPEGLLESELFGHARGAFTDAKTSRAGLFAQANGGTLFLDEIADMPLSLQPKLLRVLQERTVRPLGTTAEIPLDVRVIAATNDDIGRAVGARRFREDLYYRLAVLQIEVPPLRERGRDVELLARHFIASYAARAGKRLGALPPEMVERLVAHRWPGNVRELQNCMERVVALSEFGEIDAADLTFPLGPTQGTPAEAPDESLLPLAEVERLHILRVLEAAGRNKQVAARILGLDRRTLYRRLLQYGDPDSPLPDIGDS